MPIFHCQHCGQHHDGLPTFHADRPTPYWDVPEDKRAADVFLTSDSCVIADRFFFVRGCLDIPIRDHDDVFTWGVWVSLSEENFFLWQDCYDVEIRSHIGPFFGWLCTRLPIYPDTMHLKPRCICETMESVLESNWNAPIIPWPRLSIRGSSCKTL